MFGFPHGRRHGTALPDAPPALFALALSAYSIAENSGAGTVVGAILNRRPGSALVLTDDAGSRFAISGANIVAGATATDYESAVFHNITITETLGGAIGSPRATTLTINVTDVAEGAPALTISGAPTIGGDMVVGGTLFQTSNGLYSGVTPDSYSLYWFLDGVLLDTETLDNLLIVDTYDGLTITFAEIAHKAGYTDGPLNFAA